MSSEIKSLSAQLARVRDGVKARVASASARLGAAESGFHKAADGTEGYAAQVDAYAAELQALTAELTNGGPPLGEEFRPVAVPAVGSPAAMLHGVPVSGRAAVIATQHELGREHNPA